METENKRDYVRADRKVLSLIQIKSLFDDGTFSIEGPGRFDPVELGQALQNMVLGIELPQFGAREDERGMPHFKSAKLHQLVKAAHDLADSGTLSPLASRRLRGSYINVIVISDTEFYNPGITRDEISKYLTFYL